MRVLHSRFSPQHLDPAVLERRMVGRDDDARTLVDGVVETLSHGGARYELIVAPRGLGKTHLLTVVAFRLRRHPVVLERALLLSLDEEEHVSGLLDLFRRVLRAMPPVAGLPDAPTLAAGIRLPTEGDGVDPVVGMIRARLGDRALVLLLENFDRLLAALSEQERWRLRGVLEAEARFSIIATAQRLPPTLTGRKEAFYHKFHRFPLRPLTAEECGLLLHDLAVDGGKLDLAKALEDPEGRGRVRSIHHLLGGTPRAMALLFPYLTVDTLRSLEDAFYPLGDELTPYIQEQWRNRAPGEQAVLEALAQSWRPLTVTEISTSTLSAPSSVSKQLGRLSADELVQVVSVGKERFYSIGDPLARIGRAMKSAEEAPRVFIRFLRHWHTQGELSLHLIEELDPLKRDVWQAALTWNPDVASAFTRSMDDEVGRLLDADEVGAAVSAADWAWLAEPCVETSITLLQALSAAQDWARYADVVETSIGRFDAGRIARGVVLNPPNLWRPLLPRCREQLRAALALLDPASWSGEEGRYLAKMALLAGLVPRDRLDSLVKTELADATSGSWMTLELLILREVLILEGRGDLVGAVEETLVASLAIEVVLWQQIAGKAGFVRLCVNNNLSLSLISESVLSVNRGFSDEAEPVLRRSHLAAHRGEVWELGARLCHALQPNIGEANALATLVGEMKFSAASSLWSLHPVLELVYTSMVAGVPPGTEGVPERVVFSLAGAVLFMETATQQLVYRRRPIHPVVREALGVVLGDDGPIETIDRRDKCTLLVCSFVLLRLIHNAPTVDTAHNRAVSFLSRLCALESSWEVLWMGLTQWWIADPAFIPHAEAVLRALPGVGEESTIRRVVDTLLAAAGGNHRPWARLAPPEREVVLTLLKNAGERGIAIAEALPPIQ